MILAMTAVGFSALQGILARNTLDREHYDFAQARLLPRRAPDLPTLGEGYRTYYTKDGESLVAHLRGLPGALPVEERRRMILRSIFKSAPGEDLRSPIPEGSKLRSVFVIEKVAYVDISSEFAQPALPSPRGERLAVYSIVNGLVLNDSSIDAVQILVDGKPVETVWGWIDCSSPLGANLGLIERGS